MNTLKNGQNSNKSSVLCSLNNVNISLLNVLWEEGFINGYFLNSSSIKVVLKYNKSKSLIKFVKFFSKPSQKVFISSSMIWKLNDKLGIYVLSTNKGLLTSKKCKKYKLGGLLMFFIK